MLNQMISCVANIKVLIRLLLAAARNVPVALYMTKTAHSAHGNFGISVAQQRNEDEIT
jgi:hypothetical protein